MAEVGEGHCWLCGGWGKADEDDVGRVVACARKEVQGSAGEEEEGGEGEEDGGDKDELVAVGHRLWAHQQRQAWHNRDSTAQQRQAQHNSGKHDARSGLALTCTLAVPAATAIRFIKQKPKKTRNGPATQAAPRTATVVHGLPQKHKKTDSCTAIVASPSPRLRFPPQRRGRSRALCALCRWPCPGHPRPVDRLRGQRPRLGCPPRPRHTLHSQRCQGGVLLL